MTEALQPGGFEMLAGIPVRGKSGSLGPAGPPRSSTKEARRRAAVIKQAEAELVRARKGEAEATRHWDRMRDKVERARKAWEEAREKVQKTERALAELRTQP